MMKKKKQSIPVKPKNSSLGGKHVSSVQDLLTKGFKLHQNGDLVAAGHFYAQILQIQPLHFDALHLSGLIAAKTEQFVIAEELIKKALSLNPNNPAAHCNLGNLYMDQGKFQIAIECYNKALTLKPNYEEAIYSRGVANQNLNQLDASRNDYEDALKINPRHIGTLTNLGNVLQLQKKYDEAIEYYQKAIALGLPIAEPFNNRGNLYHERKQYQNAIQDFERALELRPDYPEALSNRANTLFACKFYDEALKGYNKAIELKPNYPEALHNRGNLYREVKKFELAKQDYQKVLLLKPDYEYVPGLIFATQMNICDWSNFDSNRVSVEAAINRFEKAIPPFLTIPISDSIEVQRKAGEIWVSEKFELEQKPSFINKPIENRKIRIAYFSGDFHDHATMHLMAEIFELHDKEKFEIFGFSFGPDRKDSYRQRAVAAFDQFYDVRDLGDKEIAKLSRDLEVDIAIDLKGYTSDSRVGIFFHRAAPIQINYLGYPGTMGAKFIDYIIADRVIIPEDLRHLYAEQVIYMPDSYQPNDRTRIISDRKYSRQELGLPESGFVYCSFNANYKINPSVLDMWVEILKAVDNSVLWLLGEVEYSIFNLKQEAIKRGIDADRLVFASSWKQPEHLARHQAADLFLDTWPCNAHTTTSDALWAGLPVLTVPGQAFHSRVAASLLSAVDMPELIMPSHEDYFKTAVMLGRSPQEIARLKQKLKDSIFDSKLFDTSSYIKNLELLYEGLVRVP